MFHVWGGGACAMRHPPRGRDVCYQTFTWNLRVIGRVALPLLAFCQSTETATVVLSFVPQVEGLPTERTYPRSPMPTETSAMAGFGARAEVGPTIMSSRGMFVITVVGSLIAGVGLAKGGVHPSTAVTWMLLNTAAVPVGMVVWISLVASCVSTSFNNWAYVYARLFVAPVVGASSQAIKWYFGLRGPAGILRPEPLARRLPERRLEDFTFIGPFLFPEPPPPP